MTLQDPYIEMASRYPIAVIASDSDPPFRAEIPDFPHILAGGDSIEEAYDCAVHAIADALEYLDDEGLPAPEVSPPPRSS